MGPNSITDYNESETNFDFNDRSICENLKSITRATIIIDLLKSKYTELPDRYGRGYSLRLNQTRNILLCSYIDFKIKNNVPIIGIWCDELKR